MINLELYKIFVIVAKEQNLTAASNILSMPQYKIAENIKDLEQLLKIKLFKRTTNGLVLTETGSELYNKLKSPINEIIYIDDYFNSIKTINIGAHHKILGKVFGQCLNQFSLEYPKINLNIEDLDTDEMLNMLSNKFLNIVLSKKIDNIEYDNIQYIKLGYLNDIFIISKKSSLAKKTLTIENLNNNILYLPRIYSQISNKFLSVLNNNDIIFKYSNYNNILELVSSSSAIGLITKEYLDKNSFKKYNLVELETDIDIDPIEFGIYLNNDRFKELNHLIQTIKKHFFFNDF